MSSTVEDKDDIDHYGGGGKDLVANKDECTSCEQNNVDAITDDFSSVALLNDKSTCASCGKEGNSSDMNTCNKCKMVKYCNAACKKKHRSKHKKACERKVAELHDEQLFKEPPPNEECPICLLPLMNEYKTETFMACCGKVICMGCIGAMIMSEGKELCAFCRMPPPTSNEEEMNRLNNLIDKGNARAIFTYGHHYYHGDTGLVQDHQKANELYLKAGELGYTAAYYNLGKAYNYGDGVEVDMKKAQYYYELATIGGDMMARYKLGVFENDAGNTHRAMKHFTLAAKAGDKLSLNCVKEYFMHGSITKDDYANTLREYQNSRDEMKSEQRDITNMFFQQELT